MSVTSFKISADTKFSPFTGKPINYPVGTIIYGDYGSKKDLGTTNPSSQTKQQTNTTTPTIDPALKAFNETMVNQPKRNEWKISNWQMGENGWATQPILTINGKEYRFNTPQEYITAMSGLPDVSKYTNQFQSAIPYWESVTKKTTPTPPQTPTTTQPTTPAPAPAPTTTPTQTSTSNFGNAKNLLEFYQKMNKSLPSISERASLYEATTGNPASTYTGTKDQNDSFLTGLNSFLSENPTGVPSAALNPENYRSYNGGKVNEKINPVDTVQKNEQVEWVSDNQGEMTPTNTTNSTSNNLFDTDYYGQNRNQGLEDVARKEEGWAEDSAINQGWVSPTFIKTLDADTIGMYINALAYGGYTIGDVVNDIKRREMANNGNVEAKDLTIIDPDMIREIYYSTPEGNNALTQTAKVIPTFNLQGLLNPELLKYGVNNIPDELFKVLTPLQDKDSQEFKDAVDAIQLGYIDRANNSLQAETEQEKAKADYDMKVFKDEIERTYGIALSDDADKAWAQIEAIKENYSQRGISGSGFQNEAIDKELRATREADQRMREDKLSQEEKQKASYYKSSASEAEIAALSPEEREKYGLVPSADILSKFSIEEMRKLDPNATDAELQAYRDSIIDANGNYRSALYKNYYSGLANNAIARKTTAEGMVLQDSLNKEKRAGEVWDNQDSFSKATKEQQKIMNDAAATQSKKEQGTENPVTTTPTVNTSNPYDNNSYEEMQKKVNAANEASKKAAKVLSQKYTPGTVETYFPSYKSGSNTSTGSTTQPTSTVKTNQPTVAEMQAKVDAANKASQAAAKVLGTTYKPGTIATYFPDYKM